MLQFPSIASISWACRYSPFTPRADTTDRSGVCFFSGTCKQDTCGASRPASSVRQSRLAPG